MYSYHPSAQSIRTAFAVFSGFTVSIRWPKRKPPQVARDDQHCTHFMRESLGFLGKAAQLCQCERLRLFQKTTDLEPIGCRIERSHRDVPHDAKSELIGHIGRNEEFVLGCLREPTQAQANRGACRNSKKTSSIHDISRLCKKRLNHRDTEALRKMLCAPDPTNVVTSLLLTSAQEELLSLKPASPGFANPRFYLSLISVRGSHRCLCVSVVFLFSRSFYHQFQPLETRCVLLDDSPLFGGELLMKDTLSLCCSGVSQTVINPCQSIVRSGRLGIQLNCPLQMPGCSG